MSRVQARCWVVGNAHTATNTATKDGPIIVITEAQIKAAVRAAVAGKPRTALHDRGARGAGRLILVVRSKGTAAAPSAEFFAAWYRSGKRVMSKLGSYPTISLTDARRRFREEFAPASHPAPSLPARPPGDGTARRPGPLASCSPPMWRACRRPASARRTTSMACWPMPPTRSDRADRPARSPGRYRAPSVGDPRSRGQGSCRCGSRVSERGLRLRPQIGA
jgi:hypothetical protein